MKVEIEGVEFGLLDETEKEIYHGIMSVINGKPALGAVNVMINLIGSIVEKYGIPKESALQACRYALGVDEKEGKAQA